MRVNKKIAMISWFIGLGTGLFLSGVILSIIMYTSNRVSPTSENPIAEVELEIKDEQDGKNNHQAYNGEIEEIIADSKTEDKTNIQTMQEIETIELDIEPTSTAREITRLLVDNGVIADYDEFIKYIVLHDAERILSHGTKTFPLNSDIETVFKILRP